MKRFIKRVLLYSISVLFIAVIVDVCKTAMGIYDKTVSGSEIYCAINKSQIKKKVKKLLLGDSVGCQLYPCQKDYDTIASLACNQAITMAGQYFLLKSFIENNDELPNEVVLLITPFSLKNDVDKYAYHYFLKPFPYHQYSNLYTNHLKERIQTIPFFWSANLPLIHTSSYSPKWAVPLTASNQSISQLSYEYLIKMDSITKCNGIKFRMISTPVRDDRRDDMDSFWDHLPTDYADKLDDLLQPYKESVIFMPSDYYGDEVHFLGDKIPDDYLGILK